MQVTVKFFATYREVVGRRELKVELEDGATLRDLRGVIYARHPRLKGFEETMLLAVNQELADPGAPLRDGDEVALLPPVSGGTPLIEVQRKAIDVESVVDAVHRLDAGAVVLFLGTVRADPGVKALDYEVYRPMAVKKMVEIAERAKGKFGVLEVAIVHRLVYRTMALRKMAEIAERAKGKFGALEVAIVHRLGRIRIGRPSVAIAVSAAHRGEAFAACEWAMAEVKKVVPIWKAEK